MLANRDCMHACMGPDNIWDGPRGAPINAGERMHLIELWQWRVTLQYSRNQSPPQLPFYAAPSFSAAIDYSYTCKQTVPALKQTEIFDF